MGFFDNIKESFTSKLLPRRCPLCGRMIGASEMICGTCSDELVTLEPPRCECCGRDFYECVCPDEGFWFDRCTAPFVYTKSARNGVRRLKFKGDTGTAGFFARRMAAVVKQEYANYDIAFVACVPTHRSDWEEKGYNHAALIAKNVANDLELKFVGSMLQKTRKNEKQHTLNRAERQRNVRGAYRVTRSELVAGRTILLCDDVSTTGSTLNECARVLKAAGAKRVLCVTATLAQRSAMAAEKQGLFA